MAAAAAALAGCASHKEFGGDPALHPVPTGVLPAPSRIDERIGGEPFYIGPYDKLTVTVFGIEGLDKFEAQVDSSGYITFPMAGVLEVGGNTLGEVQQEIAARLRANYVRDPQVAVNLKEAADRVVTVEGQVSKPGEYPIVGRTTLLRALAIAGSPTEFARLQDVILFREVSGQRYAALYNVAAIRRGMYSDPIVYPNDLVVVDESRSRRLFKDLLQVAPLLTTPLVLMLQNNGN